MADKKTKAASESVERIVITKPNLPILEFEVIGTAPYVQHAFGQKARNEIRETQEAGSKARKGKKKEARNFEADFEQAKHTSTEGWLGIPAPAFRNAMIDACRLVGYKMTHARISLFILPDGFDRDDYTPLVKINGGVPEIHISPVRLATGVASLASRPMWPHWSAKVKIQYDGDQFTPTDVGNLLERAGLQVGIGEGRPFSKKSNGVGWGTFKLKEGQDNA